MEQSSDEELLSDIDSDLIDSDVEYIVIEDVEADEEAMEAKIEMMALKRERDDFDYVTEDGRRIQKHVLML